MAEMDNKVIIAIFAPILGIFGWLLKHMSNPKKHPCSDDIVYKEVCEAKRDCIEAKIDGLQKVIETRFDSLEDLLKKGGKKRG